MSPATISPLSNVKALCIDVFGTVVDWRSSVTEELILRAYRKQTAALPPVLRSRLDGLGEEDWACFAQEWRQSYMTFCASFDAEHDAWKTVDQHHHDSLIELLQRWGLAGLYSDTEIDSLSLVWHRLNPWPDSSPGLHALGRTYSTATLSNGNVALLRDLDDFGDLGFRRLLSAENFGAYKPKPAVYLGAVRELGLEAGQVALVAAHLADLAAARDCGLRTVYVERDREETWKPEEERYQEALEWVDVWISREEQGFLALARKLHELA